MLSKRRLVIHLTPAPKKKPANTTSPVDLQAQYTHEKAVGGGVEPPRGS